MQGFVTAPSSGVDEALLVFSLVSNGSGAASFSMIQPDMSLVGPDRTTHPPFAPGRNAYDAADVTASNTAAAITGQGPLATTTPPSYAGNAAAYAALGAGQLFTDTSDSNKVKTTVATGADSALYVATSGLGAGANVSGTGWTYINGVTTPALTGKTVVTCLIGSPGPVSGDTMPTNGTMTFNWRVKSGTDEIASGTMSILQSPGDPPEISALTTPSGAPFPLSSTAAQDLILEVQRTGGPADLNINGFVRARYE